MRSWKGEIQKGSDFNVYMYKNLKNKKINNKNRNFSPNTNETKNMKRVYAEERMTMAI